MLQFLAIGLCKGAVYALLGLGFGLIFTTSRVFHIALGAVYALGGYSIWCFSERLKWHFLPAALATLICVTTVGVLVEVVVYQPLEKKLASREALLISSLGVYIILVNLLALIAGNDTRILSGGESTVSFATVILTRVQVAQVTISVLVIVLYWVFLKKTCLGMTCRAVADDPVLASVLGVSVRATRIVVFTVGSMLAVVGSILITMDIGTDPQVGLSAVLVATVACVIGGLHRFIAPALGGLLLGFVQGLVAWRVAAKWENSLVFAILIGFLLVRPHGILGVGKRMEER